MNEIYLFQHLFLCGATSQLRLRFLDHTQ